MKKKSAPKFSKKTVKAAQPAKVSKPAKLSKGKKTAKPARPSKAAQAVARVRESSVFQKGKQILSRSTADGAISIISMDNMKAFYQVDAWAAKVWTFVDGKTEVSKIIQKVQQISKADTGLIAKETVKLITDLSKAGLLEQVK